MQLELASGAVRLGANQVLKLRDGAGATVCAHDGAVWITEENQPRDIVLAAGSCYRLQRPGVALVNAIGGEASISVVEPVKRWLGLGLGTPKAA